MEYTLNERNRSSHQLTGNPTIYNVYNITQIENHYENIQRHGNSACRSTQKSKLHFTGTGTPRALRHQLVQNVEFRYRSVTQFKHKALLHNTSSK